MDDGPQRRSPWHGTTVASERSGALRLMQRRPPQVKRLPALRYLRRRWPFFNRTLEQRRPAHILPPHAIDYGFGTCAPARTHREGKCLRSRAATARG